MSYSGTYGGYDEYDGYGYDYDPYEGVDETDEDDMWYEDLTDDDLVDHADLDDEDEDDEDDEDERDKHEYMITATVQFLVQEPYESWAMIAAKDRLNEFLKAGHAGNDPLNGATIEGVQMLDGGE